MWTIQELSHDGPIKKFYILDQFTSFLFLTIQEYSIFPPIHEFCMNILKNYKKKTFWTFQEFSHNGRFQNFEIPDHSRICTFLTISFSFYAMDNFRMFIFWKNSLILHSGSFQNFYILDYSKKNTFYVSRIFTF